MKKVAFIIFSFVCFGMFASSTIAASENQMSVQSFAMKLAKELNIDKDIKGDKLADIIAVFPENLQKIFNDFKGDFVSRALAADIFSYFLDATEIESLRMSGKEDDILPTDSIDSLFSKSSKKGDVLTYIVSPSYSFTNRLDTKLNELYQTKGSGDTGY